MRSWSTISWIALKTEICMYMCYIFMKELMKRTVPCSVFNLKLESSYSLYKWPCFVEQPRCKSLLKKIPLFNTEYPIFLIVCTCVCCFFRPWKFEHMATDLLSLQLREDHPLPPDAVLFFTQSLIHDSISIRKVCSYVCALYVCLGLWRSIKWVVNKQIFKFWLR